MKDFLVKLATFSVPILLYVFLALYVDPYDIVFEEKNEKINNLESKISQTKNYRLYHLSKFINQPNDVIILGDSRSLEISSNSFDKLINKKSSNLAYAGASLSEIIETFWYVSKIKNLKEVYIGINFNLWNKHNNFNLVNEAIDIIESPIKYIFSKYCFKSSLSITKSIIFNKSIINIEKPKLNKNDFWNYKLESHAINFYRIWNYPDNYFREISEISKYCKSKNIKLVFFTPPTHIESQFLVKDYKLISQELNFKNTLSQLGIYFDFDYPNDITKNKENFTDPLHTKSSITKIISNEISGGKIKYAKNPKQ